MDSPLKYFAQLRNPSLERNREYLLDETLLMAIARALSRDKSRNDLSE